MKRVTLLLLCCLVCLLSCENQPSTGAAAQLISTASFVASPDQDTASYVPLYLHDIPAEHELKSALTSQGGFGQLLTPPMEQRIAKLLCKSYWVVESYVDRSASRSQKAAGTGQWIQCFPNGTFFGGHWDRQTHSGTWYLDNQPEKPHLTLDSNVDRLDAVWEIHGVRDDLMTWTRLSNGGFGPQRRSLHSKWIELYDRPTKAQFAGIHKGL